MLPITELRLSIPIGFFEYNLTLTEAVPIAIIGNFLICIPILYCIGFAEKIILKVNAGKLFLDFLYKRTRSKTKIIQKYKYIGLILFVGIPLPLTGAWTGCLASYLFGFSKKRSLMAIIVGLIVSSTLISLIVLFFQDILIYIGYEF